MRRVALRGIRAHLVRFILSLLAVALGVAFVAGTFSLRTMMSNTFHGIVDSSAPADAYLQPFTEEDDSIVMGGVSGTVPLALVDEAAQIDGVAHAIPEVSGSVVLVGADGTAVQSTQAPSMALLFVPEDPWLDVVQGRGPERAGEVALESATLESSGLSVGDTTTAVLAGEITEVTIVGEVDAGGPMAGATIVLVDQATGLALFAPDDAVSQIALYAQDGTTPEQLVDRIAPLTDASVEAVTGDALRDKGKADIDEMLGFVATFLMVFAAIALFVGAFIISNTFAMSVRQRMREFALLRAVGASPTQVFASILVQAAVVGLIGSAIGVAAGLGLVELLRIGLEQMGMSLAGDIPVDATTIIVSLLVGTLVSIVAAAIPARRAALVPPVEAMRDEVTVADKSMRVRALLGLLVTGLGAAGAIAAVANPDADSAMTLLGAGATLVIVGVLMLSPVMARATIGVLAWPFVRLLRPIGRLARGNVVRNPRRTASTAGALMIGMALVGAVSVMAVSVQDSMSSIIESEADADLVLQSANQLIPAGAVNDVANLSEVGTSDPVAGASMVVAPSDDPDGAITTWVMGLPADAFGRSFNVETIDGDLATLADGQVAVQETTAKNEGWEVGDTLTFTGGTGTAEITIGAIMKSMSLGGSLAMDRPLLNDLVPVDQQMVDAVLLSGADGVSQDELRDAVAAAVSPYVVVSVLSQEEFVSGMADQVNQVLVIFYALLGLSIVIAVLGIVNTLALSVIERTREIGLLRAVGLGRLQLSGTVVIESVLTAVFGTVVGLAVGIALAATLPSVFADQGLSSLVIPWGSLGLMLALAVVVGVFAALWPASRAARMKVLDAVSYE